MDKADKLKLSESDICDLFITPAIKKAGWDPFRQIRREVTLTPGPVVVRGNLASRNRKKKKFADYVLSWQSGMPIAIVEAKENGHSISSGLQQALGYASILDLPTALSSNGDGFASHNRAAPEGVETETQWRWLRDRGCDEMQGYLLAKPAPFEDILARLGSPQRAS